MDIDRIRRAVKEALVTQDQAHQLLDLSEEEIVLALDIARGTGETSERRAENQCIVRAALDVKLARRSAEQTTSLVEATAAFKRAVEAAAEASEENARQLEESRSTAHASEARRNRRTMILVGVCSALAGIVGTLLAGG